ncbi:Protein of uncharacterised function (DUF1471) [Klebsiella pneumoniae]|nr:Protein of uncharacterised function (DUF1471) [Klebsiella pneumoniae]
MNKLIPLIVLSCLLPLAANARTITATGDTLDHAESKIRQQAAREGATTYRITEARNGQQSAYHGENRGLKHRRQAQG